MKKASTELMLSLEETKGRETTLTAEINKMKGDVNKLAKIARSKSQHTGKKPSKAKIMELRAQAEFIVTEMTGKEQERDSLRMMLSLWGNNLARMRMFITQQETTRTMDKAMTTIRQVGLDTDTSAAVIEKSARTADEMRDISLRIQDQMQAAAPANDTSERVQNMMSLLFDIDDESAASDRHSNSLPYPEVEEQTDDERDLDLSLM